MSLNIFIEITPLMPINYIFTSLWVIGMMNSINMLDNMDGVTASVASSIILGALVILFVQGEFYNSYIIILLGVLASMIGFLFFNWYPSKMYMGDTGSQFLGAFLAAIGVVFFWNHRTSSEEFFELKQLLIPLTIFIVPIIDTLTVVSRRMLRGQSPFVGGKDHITHHLAYIGVPESLVALIFGVLSLLSVIIMYFIITNFEAWNFSNTLGVILYFIVVFALVQVIYSKGSKKKLKESVE